MQIGWDLAVRGSKTCFWVKTVNDKDEVSETWECWVRRYPVGLAMECVDHHNTETRADPSSCTSSPESPYHQEHQTTSCSWSGCDTSPDAPRASGGTREQSWRQGRYRSSCSWRISPRTRHYTQTFHNTHYQLQWVSEWVSEWVCVCVCVCECECDP